jgi:two-component system NtrC family sensor kinase
MKSPLPNELAGEAQNAWQASQALSEMLLQSNDLESICRAALQFVLEKVNRPDGALVALSPDEEKPGEASHDLLVCQGSPPDWLEQPVTGDEALGALVEHTLSAQEALAGEDLPEHLPEFERLALALPIQGAASPQGVMLVLGQPCSAHEMALLTQLMHPIGRAIHAARKLSSVHNRARELASLQMELTRMGFNTDFEGMQAQMIRGVRRILEAEASALVLLDDSQDEWMIRKSLGDDSEWLYQVNPKSGQGLVKECLHRGVITCSNDVSTDPRFDPESDGLSGLKARSLLCAPLVVNGQVLGAIQVLNKRHGEFDAYDQDLLSMIAILAANAMHGTRVIQELKVANADLEANRWELMGSRNALRALFDNLPNSLYIIDQDYKLIAVNKSRAQHSGQTPQELVGELCHQALFDRTTPCPECRVQETFQDAITTQRNERRWASTDESSEWDISTYPILSDNGQITQVILSEQDVSERRRLEAILTQSEKLAAVGQLAAGVAHEINNPLTAIIANAQILHRELPPDHDLQESVDLIARAGARATQVVRNLLDFARKEEYHLGLTDLNDTVERALELVQHEILARGIKLELNMDPKLPPILASQDHLQSVWLNLLLNAIDSLDKTPGEITVATRRLSDEIHVSVTDNGKGIPPERLTRIFEPFYTTKKAGRGTGLGLSVTHRIVKQHGGSIRVESQVGIGSTFTVVLPLS